MCVCVCVCVCVDSMSRKGEWEWMLIVLLGHSCHHGGGLDGVVALQTEQCKDSRDTWRQDPREMVAEWTQRWKLTGLPEMTLTFHNYLEEEAVHIFSKSQINIPGFMDHVVSVCGPIKVAVENSEQRGVALCG